MFTGLVETTGRVASARRRAGGARLVLVARFSGEPVRPGESIAVDGVCLTVCSAEENRLAFDVVQETLDRTTLGTLGTGRSVNLERSLRPGDRLGGHFVVGHVDTTVPVRRIARRGADHRVAFGLPASIRPYVAEKGSIAIQGVSLTVSRLGRDEFEVALVPETLRRTTLGSLRAGDLVNVEVDLLARYLEAMLRPRLEPERAGRRIERTRR
jgi:riboflavin synthase